MRGSACHVELNISDLKIGILLKNARVELEIRHEKCIQENLVVYFFGLFVFEVVHDRLLDHKQLHALQFIDTKYI